MRIVLRLALTLVLVAVMAFCCFGFFASFEPPGFLIFRSLYGAVAIACVVAIVAVWIINPMKRLEGATVMPTRWLIPSFLPPPQLEPQHLP